MGLNSGQACPKKLKKSAFNVEDYDEYEKVTGKKIIDLNKERNHMIETVKKAWNMNKAYHYKLREKNFALRFPSKNQFSVPIEIEIPIPIV